MREHICIRKPEWVAGTRERPEVGVFTQTAKGKRPTPWENIAVGETVWMKWSGGPVVAKATISGFRQMLDCTPSALRKAVAGYALADQQAYWDGLKPELHALAIFLSDEEWLDEPLDVTGKANQQSWIVFPDAEARERWMVGPPTPISLEPKDPRGPRTAGPRLRFEVFRRDSYTCQYCGRRAPEIVLHVDHILAWANGGMTEIENLRTACSTCNLGKGKRLA